jgi:hypothetical protein
MLTSLITKIRDKHIREDTTDLYNPTDDPPEPHP